jgi:hypothetical protein
MKLRNLFVGGLCTLLLGYTAQAQIDPSKIPEFDRHYAASTKNLFIRVLGGAHWWSLKKDSYTELRGSVDMSDRKFLISTNDVYVGFITRISADTTRTISYHNGDDFVLSNYDSSLALQEGMDVSRISNIRDITIYYGRGIFHDNETGQDTLLSGNPLGFQEGFFAHPKKDGLDTAQGIFYEGRRETIKSSSEVVGGMLELTVDMKKSDPKDPSKRENIVKEINQMKLYVDSSGLMYKADVDAYAPIGSALITFTYEPDFGKKTGVHDK